MKEISIEYAKANKLKRIGRIRDTDMSKLILKLERLKENKNIKYYSMDIILFDSIKHIANIEVSLWGD